MGRLLQKVNVPDADHNGVLQVLKELGQFYRQELEVKNEVVLGKEVAN